MSLDVNTVATNPEVILSHLRSRKADESVLHNVGKIGQLRAERNNCIIEGDKARNLRKQLSKDIGSLMKTGKTEEIENLKKTVEKANHDSEQALQRQTAIDNEIDTIMKFIPNLLDDR